ncbi:MAG TPA: hypothetical protein VIM55_04055 [Mucilaginibacter sp.]
MKLILMSLMLLWLGKSAGNAQSPSPPHINKEIVDFFSGSWSGEGKFANGKSIAADVNFSLSLDSCWLMYTHTDKSPNKYKATSMWGVNKNGQLIDFLFDNFGGHDKYISAGFTNNQLVWETRQENGTAAFYKRFTYQKLDADHFKMTYEASADGNTWRMGDYLVFTRKP